MIRRTQQRHRVLRLIANGAYRMSVENRITDAGGSSVPPVDARTTWELFDHACAERDYASAQRLLRTTFGGEKTLEEWDSRFPVMVEEQAVPSLD